MKIASIKWNRDRIEHIAKHKIEPYEVEQAAFDDPYNMNDSERRLYNAHRR